MNEAEDETSTRIVRTFEVAGMDFANAGHASSQIKHMLQQIGIDSGVVRQVAVATYEAEMNCVIHAGGGRITLDAGSDSVEIVVEDNGPGIPDIDRAMIPGFSTAGDEIREMGFGAGMGLPNMKSCSDVFEIKSEQGVGTTVRMVFYNG